jgi:hypothetical protein
MRGEGSWTTGWRSWGRGEKKEKLELDARFLVLALARSFSMSAWRCWYAHMAYSASMAGGDGSGVPVGVSSAIRSSIPVVGGFGSRPG